MLRFNLNINPEFKKLIEICLRFNRDERPTLLELINIPFLKYSSVNKSCMEYSRESLSVCKNPVLIHSHPVVPKASNQYNFKQKQTKKSTHTPKLIKLVHSPSPSYSIRVNKI